MEWAVVTRCVPGVHARLHALPHWATSCAPAGLGFLPVIRAVLSGPAVANAARVQRSRRQAHQGPAAHRHQPRLAGLHEQARREQGLPSSAWSQLSAAACPSLPAACLPAPTRARWSPTALRCACACCLAGLKMSGSWSTLWKPRTRTGCASLPLPAGSAPPPPLHRRPLSPPPHPWPRRAQEVEVETEDNVIVLGGQAAKNALPDELPRYKCLLEGRC